MGIKLVSGAVFLSMLVAGSVYAGPTTVNIQVDVLQRDAKGKHWDIRRGAPDIAICVTYPDFERSEDTYTQCWPHRRRGTITTRMKDLRKAQCWNKYRCLFKGIVVPDNRKFEVMVVDIDRFRHDMIGSGFCRVNKRCKVGRAQIEVRGASAVKTRKVKTKKK